MQGKRSFITVLTALLACAIFAAGASGNDPELAQGIHGDPSVVGGEPAPEGSWPSMARLLGRGCGGVLVHPKVVLTAAHCLRQGEPNLIALGTHDLTDSSQGERIQSVHTLTHPGYVDTTTGPDTPASAGGHLPYDFMLVQLAHASELGQPIELASTAAEPVAGASGMIAGWGWSLVGEGPNGNPVGFSSLHQLMQASIVMHAPAECQSSWSTAQFNPEIMLCGLGQGNQTPVADTCTGDSGGPLVAPGPGGDEDEPVLIGITSWGAPWCGTPGQPGVYGRVTAVRDWVHSAHATHSAGQALNVGSAPVGTRGDIAQVSVSSRGITDLEVGAVKAGNHTEIVGEQCTTRGRLGVGDSCQIEVRFKPAKVGNLTDHVTVSGNTYGGQLKIPVRGRALAVPYSPGLTFPNRRLKRVVRQGRLQARCKIPNRGTCQLKVEVQRSQARKLGLGSNRKPVVIGRGKASTNHKGQKTVRAKLNKKAVRALAGALDNRKKKKRRVKVRVKLTTVDAYGQAATRTRQLLLR